MSDTELTYIEPTKVDFTELKGWQYTSRYEARKQGLPQDFRDADYPLYYKDGDKCWILDFKLGDGRNMLVPCIEFLVRAYARNSEVCRTLTALAWDDVFSVFFDSTTPDEHEWIIRPSRHMRDGDAVYLAHLMYDPYTAYQSRLINSQVLCSTPEKSVLLKVAPWFRGPAEIEGRGLWINGGNTFLCLDITGCSEPRGNEIVLQRLSFDTNQGVDGAGRTVMPRPIKTAHADEFIAAVDELDPDYHSETTIVKSAPFKTLGSPRKVKKKPHIVKANTGRRGPNPPDANNHSTGQGAGSGKQTGKLLLEADAVLESHGVLRDIWQALHDIAATNTQVSDPHWYTPSERFQTSSEPKLIALDPHDQQSGKTLSWAYIDSSTKQPRGVMVIRINVAGVRYFLIELQRRKKGDEEIESFAGVLFQSHLNSYEELNDFLEEFCSLIRFEAGVVRNLKHLFPNETKFFNHSPNVEKILHRTILIKAFKAIGVSLS
ncbi:hypothetical protein [Pseudomonas yamanorum]|uniref:hypothetical protein n=1 Tax=Pseudomonas yamanorum TaxID=515393 RepID=UPI002ED3754B|nr:hypothetical protein VYI69_27220 [Pseudomonas yamanorum]